MNSDLREVRIIFQNALAHATNIAMHNATLNKQEVKVEDVITLAKQIAKEVVSIGTKKD